MNLKIKQKEFGPMQNYVYFLYFEDNVIIIDPGWDINNVNQEIGNNKLVAILLTHGHFDHVTLVPELQKKFSCPVYISKFEPKELQPNCNLTFTDDNETLNIAGLDIKCIHTPGHSPGGQCFKIQQNLFTGDTMFLDGCGRWDLPGGSKNDLVNSFQKIASLPDETIINPGHNYSLARCDVLKHQKEVNPCFKSF